MSDLVKEAAQPLSPTADLSNQAVNKRKLLAHSSRGTSVGGFSGDQTSVLVDAFAEVFAAMAISSPPPVNRADNDADTGEEEVKATDRSRETDQDDSQPNHADDSVSGPQDTGPAEFAVGEQPAKIVLDENVSENDLVLGSQIDTADEVVEVEIEETGTEASQLAVASAISQSSDEFELGDQGTLSSVEDKEQVDSKAGVTSVNSDTAKPLIQPSGNAEGPQSETPNNIGLEPGQQQDEQGGDPSESGERRHDSKDEGSAKEPHVIVTAKKPGSQATVATPAQNPNQNQNSESPLSQALGSLAPTTGDRPAVPPVSAAAVAAVGSVTAGTSSVSSTASRGGNDSAGIANGPSNAEGARSLTGSQQSGRPELASSSKSSKKADAGTNQAETLNRIKLVQRVSRAFQHLGPDGGVVRLRLAPVELGTVRVEMQIQQKKVNARVVAETEAASNALREHLPELRARLESHGMQIESLEVETQSGDSDSSALGNRSQKDSSDQRHAHGERQSRSDRAARRETREQARAVAAPVSRQPVSLASAGGVDIRF